MSASPYAVPRSADDPRDKHRSRPSAIAEFGGATQATAADQLAAWLVEAGRGAKCAYFRGHLQVARSPRNPMRHERARAAELAVAASHAERRGLVHLIQRRHGTDDYSYLMIRTALSAPEAPR